MYKGGAVENVCFFYLGHIFEKCSKLNKVKQYTFKILIYWSVGSYLISVWFCGGKGGGSSLYLRKCLI